MIKRTLVCVVLCGFMTAGSLLAHHPHGSLTVAVTNPDGSTTNWVLTLGSATALAQRGIGKTGPNALHTGDKITVKFFPAKDGSPLGALRTVIMPDGRVIQISSGSPND